MKAWLLLVVDFLLWPGCSSQNAPCTTREEDMRQRNIRLKWTQQLSIYIEEGNLIEFRCIRGYQPRPSSSSFRVQCMEGKLHYPDCIPI